MLSILAFAVLTQSKLSAPVLPAGCSPEFQRMVLSVEQSLQAGDFDAAGRKLQLLPKPNARFSWDDSNVPASNRLEFARARDAAIAAWLPRMATQFELKPGSPADIKFEFSGKLNNSPQTNAPIGLASFVSETSLPRIESVSGLVRGTDSRSTSAIDVQNDVAYTIGRYLGVADRPIATTAMARQDAFTTVPNFVTGDEIAVAKADLEAVAMLRQAVHAQVRLAPLQPKVSFDTLSITDGPEMQGTVALVHLLLTNIGQAPLTYRLMPSCSCISTGPGGELKPSEAKLVDINVNTTEWSHTLEKPVLVLTNDPDDPVQTIPLKILITPRYRWIVPGGPERLIDDSGSNVDLYLEIPFGSEIYPTGVRFDGIPGTVTIDPWKGDLANPVEGEGVKHREGYHVRLHLKGGIPGGRQLGSVVVSTTSPEFPEVSYSLGFQSGIVAMPSEVNLGAVTASTTRFVTLTRPQKPFRVLSVDTSSKSIKATFSKIDKTNDYKISLTVGGKIPSGDYVGVLHIYTDDPRQPKIDVPVRGTVG